MGPLGLGRLSGPSWAVLGSWGPSSEPLGALLEASWALLAVWWRPCGNPWGNLGRPGDRHPAPGWPLLTPRASEQTTERGQDGRDRRRDVGQERKGKRWRQGSTSAMGFTSCAPEGGGRQWIRRDRTRFALAGEGSADYADRLAAVLRDLSRVAGGGRGTTWWEEG